MPNLRHFMFLFYIVLLFSAGLYASTPKFKTYKTQQDFQGGEAKGVSISSRGDISLAPKLTEIFDTPLSFIRACVSDSRGNIYLAGGNEGEVYRINKSGTAEVIFKAPELEIFALEVDGKDNLYIGSSPDGKVYKLPSGKSGEAEESVFFEPGELYIWSIAANKRGELFVATGEDGKIFKLDRSGQSSLFYKCDDKHVVRIHTGRSGDLIAGTAGKGIVLRINAAGKAFVLFDAPLVEITDLFQNADGVIYAAATGGSRFPRGAQPLPVAPPSGDGSGSGDNAAENDEANGLKPNPAPASTGHRRRERGELYRIDADGTVKIFQTLQAERIYCISSDSKGQLLLGTGEEGRIYQMDHSGESTLLADLDEAEVTALVTTTTGKMFVATSNTGKLFRLEKQYQTKGEFITEKYDAGVISQWGSVTWEAFGAAGSAVTIQTRSGNSEEPDKTWSDWSQKYTASSGAAIQSPPARYLQVKAVLTASKDKNIPYLREISFSHLQKNVPPIIKQIYLHPPGEYYPESMNNSNHNSHVANDDYQEKNGFQNQSLGRKSQKSGYRSVSWSAQDDNRDRLSYNLFYKGIDAKTWKELVTDLAGIVYSWDSELMPDGRYEIKLIARDDLTNPPAEILSAEKVSQPFIIDNSGPEVSVIKVVNIGRFTVINFFVEDEWTKIKRMDYAVNAEEWNLLYPVDGICDSRNEQFEIKLDTRLTGENVIVIKAQDAVGNIGFGSRKFNL